MPTRSIPRRLALLLAAALLAAACGGGPAPVADDTTVADTPSPTAAQTPAGDVAAQDAEGGSDGPRIVSLSPTATEILFAIDAGDLIVAVDDQSTFPEEAPRTELSGYEPNIEAIAAYEPEVVVTSFSPPDLVPGLEALGTTVVEQPAAVTLEDTYGQITELGEVTGRTEEAAELVADMRAEIEGLVAEVPERATRPTYYHELDDTLYSVTSQTFIGAVYDLAGLDNVADAADPDGSLGGYPQLSPEFLVDADPDVVFLADTKCCGVDAESFAARPGFGDLTAVQQGRVVELDDDIASRWGPRVVDFLRTIIEATADLEG